jgi:uncharacterized membrane protein
MTDRPDDQPPGGYGAPPPGNGGYGPPPGGYGLPPGGGYGPPPGGYGPPPGGGYGPPQGGQPGYGYGPPSVGVGDAFNYGWLKFQQNVGPIVLAALAYFAAFIVIAVLWNVLFVSALAFGTDETGTPNGAGFAGLLVSGALMALAASLLAFLVQAGITRGALAITYGRRLEIATMFRVDGLGQVILASILIAIASAIGFLLCYVPGLIVAFFTQFTVHFIIDKRLSAVDAIKASFGFVNRNLGTIVVFYLASLVAYFVGTLLCGVGLLVAVPVVIIAQAFLYRRLQGEPVAA